MDFDPLLLSPKPESDDQPHTIEAPLSYSEEPVKSFEIEHEQTEESDEFTLHVHDLPILRLHPPVDVLMVFLQLLSPSLVHNFAPETETDQTTDPDMVFQEKGIDGSKVESALVWLQEKFNIIDTRIKLACVAIQSSTLRRNFESEYNSWLTRLVSSPLDWISPEDAEEIDRLASLRIAENCGRTAQPEIIRNIEIDGLGRLLKLKEPSLTSDNLGLKTWGSAFILGSRLASNPSYLWGTVLELGAGTGLVGMVASVMGHETTLTDLIEILPNLQDNTALNDISASVEELDWSDPTLFIEENGHLRYETVILSDPLYSSKHPYWIVSMVKMFLAHSKDARVLLQVPIRRSFENERAVLWKLLEDEGFKVEEEAMESGYDDFGQSQYCFKKYTRA